MMKLAALTWMFTLLIGFCVAWFLVFHVRNRLVAIGLFLLCTVPFWTSNMIRMISWLPLLGKQGVINQALMATGPDRQPAAILLYSDFSVVVSYVHLFTIFMIVPMFNAMSRIDRALFEASLDAGAGRMKTFFLVVLPLTKSGIVLGSIFVITLVMGDFYVVKVMSGGSEASVVSAMDDDISTLLFPHAAASAVILIAVLVAMVASILRFVDVAPRTGGRPVRWRRASAPIGRNGRFTSSAASSRPTCCSSTARCSASTCCRSRVRRAH